jgi:hypothetical protein
LPGQYGRAASSHWAGEGKIALLEHVPDLIKNGIFLETVYKNNKPDSHIFAARAVLDGKPSIVGFVVHGDTNGMYYYDHAIRFEEEGWAEPRSRASKTTATVPPESPTSVYNILKKHLGTNI